MAPPRVVSSIARFFLAPMLWRKPAPPAPTPAEIKETGRNTWMLLHAIAKYYPATPTKEEQSAVHALFRSLAVLYPCRKCSVVLDMAVSESLIDARTPKTLAFSLCTLHNFVNRKLGKPELPCTPPAPSFLQKAREAVSLLFSALREKSTRY